MGVRAFFIDGPDHGTTRTFESEPPKEFKTVAVMAMQGRKIEEGEIEQLATIAKHRYIRTYKTRKGIYIYEYDGLIK